MAETCPDCGLRRGYGANECAHPGSHSCAHRAVARLRADLATLRHERDAFVHAHAEAQAGVAGMREALDACAEAFEGTFGEEWGRGPGSTLRATVDAVLASSAGRALAEGTRALVGAAKKLCAGCAACGGYGTVIEEQEAREPDGTGVYPMLSKGVPCPRCSDLRAAVEAMPEPWKP